MLLEQLVLTYLLPLIQYFPQTKIGWMYEYADEETQRYKEGKFILERALIVEYDQLFGYGAQ